MSNVTSSSPVQPAVSKISHPALLGIIWGLGGLAVLFVAARIAIRIQWSRRLFADDYICILALAVLLGNTTVTTVMAPPMYEALRIIAGREEPTAAFEKHVAFYLRCQFASTMLFWTCLWAVKTCFLAFFRRLTDQTKWPKRVWYAVAIITGLSYCGSVVTYPIACTSFTLGACGTPRNIHLALVSLRYSTALDIITDLLIMTLPLYLIYGLKISPSQKWGLCAVLSLGVIIIVFSVVRIIVTNTDKVQPEVSWLALWSSVESSVAVIVACLASFKVLLTQARGSGYPGSGGGGYRGNSSSRRDTGNKRSRTGANRGSRAWVGHQELSSASFGDAEMQNLGGRRGRGTITTTGSKGARTRTFGGKEHDDDSESQQQILHGDDVKVQTTSNVTRA